jgi:hypothetical protein
MYLTFARIEAKFITKKEVPRVAILNRGRVAIHSRLDVVILLGLMKNFIAIWVIREVVNKLYNSCNPCQKIVIQKDLKINNREL